jgi:hypothetical protein
MIGLPIAMARGQAAWSLNSFVPLPCYLEVDYDAGILRWSRDLEASAPYFCEAFYLYGDGRRRTERMLMKVNSCSIEIRNDMFTDILDVCIEMAWRMSS